MTTANIGREETGSMTTIETLKKTQLRQLQYEASCAGDDAQVRLCSQAIEDRQRGIDDSAAIRACLAVINQVENSHD